MRTITDIKNLMTADFIENQAIIDAYGLTAGATFDEQFSVVSVERQFFYSVAKAMQELENLLDLHRREVSEIIENILPHRPKWYRDKALKFMIDRVLIADTDRYYTEGMTEEEITALQIVKYAAATELNGLLIIKIATGAQGNLQPITAEQQAQFTAYINEIRDAGVQVSVVNQQGDNFKCSLKVFYDAILNPENVKDTVKEHIKNYLQGLEFNGEYSNMALVDVVQNVEGVKIVSFISAESVSSIADKFTPVAGYFTYNEDNINLEMTAYAIQ